MEHVNNCYCNDDPRCVKLTKYTPHKSNWEEEFDGRFGQFWSRHLGGNVIYGGELTQPPSTWVTVDQESIKSFITTLLASEKKALVGKLEVVKKRCRYCLGGKPSGECPDYNHDRGIDTAIALINNETV